MVDETKNTGAGGEGATGQDEEDADAFCSEPHPDYEAIGRELIAARELAAKGKFDVDAFDYAVATIRDLVPNDPKFDDRFAEYEAELEALLT